MNHSFDIEHARLYGMAEAVIISNLQYWIGRNKANGENFKDGRTWTYNSVKAFAELFPYMTANTVRRALDHLVECKVLVCGNYNVSTYDRTKWYAFFDESTFLPCQIHLAKNTNGTGKSAKTVNTNINTDITANITPGEGEYPTAFEQAWAAYPQRPGASKKAAFKAWSARVKAGADPEQILDGVIKYASYVTQKHTEPNYIKQPETFFGPSEHYKADWTVFPTNTRPGLVMDNEAKRRATNEEALRLFRASRSGKGEVIDV